MFDTNTSSFLYAVVVPLLGMDDGFVMPLLLGSILSVETYVEARLLFINSLAEIFSLIKSHMFFNSDFISNRPQFLADFVLQFVRLCKHLR